MTSPLDPDEPRWPGRVLELAARFRSAADPATRDGLLAELWTLVNLALQRYVRASARGTGGLDLEDVRDIAAEKALDFLRKLDDPHWDAAMYAPAQICTFLKSMARNGTVDRARLKRREISDNGLPAAVLDPTADPGATFEGASYARAIVVCLSELTQRARLVWFLRAFYELKSAEIARHTKVTTTPAAVDTMLLRSRDTLRDCMTKRGLDPLRLPPGTFAALWEVVLDAPSPGSQS